MNDETIKSIRSIYENSSPLIRALMREEKFLFQSARPNDSIELFIDLFHRLASTIPDLYDP